MVEELSKWTANFLFHNTPLTVLELKSKINNVDFIMELWQPRPTDTPEVKLNGFNIIVPNATMKKARFEAEGKANIIFNYLTGIQRYPVRGHLTNMINDKGENMLELEAKMTLHKSFVIDLADINKLIEGSDEKQLRQLAHYSRGIEAADIITKYREFYQVFEEDLSKYVPSQRTSIDKIKLMSPVDIEEYEILIFIRNLVNHPELTKERPKVLAEKLAVKTSLNFNNPEELELVKNYLKIIQEKAKDIVEEFVKGK